MSKKLLLIGSISGNAHLRNYYNLIKDYFDEVLIVAISKVDYCNSVELDFSLKNPFRVFKSIKKLKKIIQDYKPSIIHVHQANSFGYITSMANKGRYPQIMTTWGSDVLELPNMGVLYKYIVVKSLRSSAIITADASFMAKKIQNLIGNVEVTIVNFGIELDMHESSIKEHIIYSNRMHESLYNIDKIIEGISAFLHKNPHWKLIIGAVGQETDRLKEQAKKLLPKDSFEFIGFVSPEINANYYKKSSIYISIPQSDGTSISLLEAMNYGCVPVLSDIPANNEWIKDAKNGIIVKNNETITSAVERALLLSQNDVSAINAEIIQKKATKKANKEIFESLYDTLLQSKIK